MDVFEVARFSTITEAGVAVAFLRSREVDARLPDRGPGTIYPLWGGAFGGVRVLAPESQIAAARALIEQARAGAFMDDGAEDWRLDAIPGKVGELDEGQIHGVLGGMTPAARWMTILWLAFGVTLFIGGLFFFGG